MTNIFNVKAQNRAVLVVLLCASPIAFGQAKQTAKRIVSLSLASDEILVDLLQRCKKSDALVAVSVFADDPSASHIAGRLTQVSARVHSEPESILRLKPDLVIAASFNRPELLNLLTQKKISMKVLDRFSSHLDIAENIRTIGKAVDCQTDADVMVKTFLSRIEDIKSKTSSAKAETAISWSSDLTVMAQGTLFDDLLAMNHLTNVASVAGLKNWPRISQEALQKWNPDWIVIGCDQAECSKIKDQIRADIAWKKLPAVQKSHFIIAPPRDLLSTSQYFGVELHKQKTHP